MLNSSKISETIKKARLKKNMTQMELADKLFVSCQAVSNWERGNSMPDIGNISALCDALDISIEDLFGGNSKETNTVRQIADGKKDIPLDDIANVAPIVKPDVLAEAIKTSSKNRDIPFSPIVKLAPFLDEETLDEIVLQCKNLSIEEISALAPFLSEEALGAVVEKIIVKDDSDFDTVVALAPFLSDETMKKIVLGYLHKQA